MGWSTRELADLAGVSLRAVRHYHDVGLLDEPGRAPNGYKQYGVNELVRVMRVKRLTDLGFSLAQIAEMDEPEGDPQDQLRALDAELAATIDRLSRARADLAALLQDASALDLPPGVDPVAGEDLGEAERSMIHVLSRILRPEQLTQVADAARLPALLASEAELKALPPDADEATRADLAARMTRAFRTVRPDLPAPTRPGTQTGARATQAVEMALTEWYNPAQVDVLRRLREAVAEEPQPPTAPSTEAPTPPVDPTPRP